MDLFELVQKLISAGPTVVYLAGVVWLWRQLELQRKEQLELVERYHTLVVEHVKTLTILSEQLEKHNAAKD